jgi:acetyl esterase/lipase
MIFPLARWLPLVGVSLVALQGAAVQAQRTPGSLPKPDVANAKYGPHERNVLDLWKAKTKRPTPLVVFIHGGAFRAGSKSTLAPDLLDAFLEAGISVAAINYRLSQDAPFPAPMLDSARAIQFLRLKAKDWDLDSERIGATGASTGSGIALWIGFHADLANPKSDDPVEQQSSRLTCVGVFGPQTTYDPRVIKQWVGGRVHEHPGIQALYGLKASDMDTPRAHQLFTEASPITYLTANAPPVFLYYFESKNPLPPDARPGEGFHHPNFGIKLKEKMDALKVECVLRLPTDYADNTNIPAQMKGDMVAFMRRHLKAGDKAPTTVAGPGPLKGRGDEIITPPARGERSPDTLKSGDLAPEFTLKDLAGQQEITLSSFRGKKPVVLIFGSFT